MDRMKIEMPRDFDFTTELRVRVGDINYGGHLGNDAVLTFDYEKGKVIPFPTAGRSKLKHGRLQQKKE